MNEDIVFFRADGTPAKNVVLTNYDKKTGEYVFFELLGMTDKTPSINGKNKYKRLLIQRVFPYQLVNNDEIHNECQNPNIRKTVESTKVILNWKSQRN